METTLRALFIGEGALGPGVMGHARAQGVLRHQLATQDVDARFASLPPAGPFARAAMRGVPYLETTDLDLHTVRRHVAQGVRARRVIDRELARGGPFDVLHVHSHTISFLSHAHMRRIPTLLSLDATVWQWHEREAGGDHGERQPEPQDTMGHPGILTDSPPIPSPAAHGDDAACTFHR